MTRIELNNTEESPAWKPDAHCLALDGIRGLAILAVTLYRLCKELDPEAHPVLAMIRRFAPIGERGVDLFFVLSGFLITGILLRTKSQPHYFRNFMMRRVLRIFRSTFSALLLVYLSSRICSAQKHLAKQVASRFTYGHTHRISEWLGSTSGALVPLIIFGRSPLKSISI